MLEREKFKKRIKPSVPIREPTGKINKLIEISMWADSLPRKHSRPSPCRSWDELLYQFIVPPQMTSNSFCRSHLRTYCFSRVARITKNRFKCADLSCIRSVRSTGRFTKSDPETLSKAQKQSVVGDFTHHQTKSGLCCGWIAWLFHAFFQSSVPSKPKTAPLQHFQTVWKKEIWKLFFQESCMKRFWWILLTISSLLNHCTMSKSSPKAIKTWSTTKG